MTTEIIGKTCTSCMVFKLFSDYTKHKRGLHGYRSACKACTNAINTAWRLRNPDASKAATKAWRDADPDRARASVKASRQKSEKYQMALAARAIRMQEREATQEEREKLKAQRAADYGAAYRKANKERLRERNLAYKAMHKHAIAAKRSAHPEKTREYNAAYRAAHPGRHRVYDNNKRIARAIAKGEGRLSEDLAERLYLLQKGKCPCCSQPLGDDYHLDHIIPLALGGTNTDENMQLLRAVCNMQKHAKHPVDFMQSRGFLL